MSIDWGLVWAFVWPILREGVIALLISLLALLGYDRVVPSRFVRTVGGQEALGLLHKDDNTGLVGPGGKDPKWGVGSPVRRGRGRK